MHPRFGPVCVSCEAPLFGVVMAVESKDNESVVQRLDELVLKLYYTE